MKAIFAQGKMDFSSLAAESMILKVLFTSLDLDPGRKLIYFLFPETYPFNLSTRGCPKKHAFTPKDLKKSTSKGNKHTSLSTEFLIDLIREVHQAHT